MSAHTDFEEISCLSSNRCQRHQVQLTRKNKPVQNVILKLILTISRITVSTLHKVSSTSTAFEIFISAVISQSAEVQLTAIIFRFQDRIYSNFYRICTASQGSTEKHLEYKQQHARNYCIKEKGNFLGGQEKGEYVCQTHYM